MRLLGAVFAGGQARRFGSDKALVAVEGVPLIGRVIAALATQAERVVIVGRPWPGQPVIADLPHPGLGPLGALAGALAFAEREGFAAVLTSGCDLPDVPLDLATRLGAASPPSRHRGGSASPTGAARHEASRIPAVAGMKGRERKGHAAVIAGQPLLGLWRTALLPALLDRLAATDDRSMRGWIKASGAVEVPLPAPLANINTAEDLAVWLSARADRRSLP